MLAAGRLWERGPADPDFGQLRIGRGDQWLATRLVAPQTGPVEGIEPITALALRRFLRGHAVVAELPVALSLRTSATVWLEPAAGPRPGRGPGAGPRRSSCSTRCCTARPTRCSRSSRRRRSRPRVGLGRSGCRTSRTRSLRDAVGPGADGRRDAEEVRRWWAAELAGRAGRAGRGASRTC